MKPDIPLVGLQCEPLTNQQEPEMKAEPISSSKIASTTGCSVGLLPESQLLNVMCVALTFDHQMLGADGKPLGPTAPSATFALPLPAARKFVADLQNAILQGEKLSAKGSGRPM